MRYSSVHIQCYRWTGIYFIFLIENWILAKIVLPFQTGALDNVEPQAIEAIDGDRSINMAISYSILSGWIQKLKRVHVTHLIKYLFWKVLRVMKTTLKLMEGRV